MCEYIYTYVYIYIHIYAYIYICLCINTYTYATYSISLAHTHSRASHVDTYRLTNITEHSCELFRDCTEGKPNCVGKCVPIGQATCPMKASSSCKAPVTAAQCAKTNMTALEVCPDPDYVDPNKTFVCNCEDYQAGKCHHVPTVTSITDDLAKWWMVQSYPLCCDFEGRGSACSSGQACLPSQFSSKREKQMSRQVNAYLGDGAITRRPKLLPSSRPTGIKGGNFQQQLSNFESTTKARRGSDFVPQSSWVQVCIDGIVHANNCPVIMSNPKQPGANWFKARFGHTMAVLGSTRVIIFGGFICRNKTCAEYHAHGDTWEIDLRLVQSTTEALMTLRELSPVGRPVGGVQAISRGAENLLYISGGSKTPFSMELLAGVQSSMISEPMEARELLVFESKMKSLASTHWPALSGHSAVANTSLAVMFGGFIGNTLTSAVFKYTFSAPTGDSAFEQVYIKGQVPSDRGFAQMNMLGSETFLLAGGISTALNDSGVGYKRVGLGDIWTYSFVTTKWTQTEGFGSYTVNAFGASTSFKAADSLFFLTHGGVSEQFVPGVSSSKTWRPQATNPYPYGPGKRQPTAEMKVLLPSSWVTKGGAFNRWIRVKPQAWNVNCMSLQPLCNDMGDDYWKCYSAPIPWWIDLGEKQNAFSVRPCTWSQSTTKYGRCARNSDPETQLCTVDLPPSMTCEPAGRFMHTITAGTFAGGEPSAILYGGINMYDKMLSDTWIYNLTTLPTDASCSGCGFLFRMALNVNVSSLTCDQHYLNNFSKIVAKMFTQGTATYENACSRTCYRVRF